MGLLKKVFTSLSYRNPKNKIAEWILWKLLEERIALKGCEAGSDRWGGE